MVTEVKIVDLTKYALDASRWYVSQIKISHLTGHTHYNSPIESDDDCGTCDGANCDRCHREYENTIQMHGFDCIELEEICKKEGVPDDVASDMIYNDYYNPYSGGWQIHWPTWEEIEYTYPDEAKKI